jgi:hypothetical protein
MFSGYLQAGVYKGMNGLHGLPGWKWLFIMDGVISLPIACAGFFLIPDLPENSRAFYLRKDQIELAVKRMDDVGRAPRSKLGWSAWKRIFGRWHVYLLTVLYIIFINAVSLPGISHPNLPQLPETQFTDTITATLRLRPTLHSLAQSNRKILHRADQRDPDLASRRPARPHGPLRRLLRSLAQPPSSDVCVDVLGLLHGGRASGVDRAGRAQVVCLRDVPGVCAVWADKYGVGEVCLLPSSPPLLPSHLTSEEVLLTKLLQQRDLLRRRRRARHRAGHHERFRLRRQRLAALPRLPRRRRSGVP